MPEEKELDFFAAECAMDLPRTQLAFLNGRCRWDRGLEWYESQFEFAKAIGEASPRYTMHPAFPGVPQRIAQMIPNAKLVYVIRHPVKRAISHYAHRVRAKQETRPIETVLRNDPWYLDTSRYAYQIEQYLKCFPEAQLLIVIAERLHANREQTMAQVFEFIGVDPNWRDPALNIEHNVSGPVGPPRPVISALRRTRWWRPVATHIPPVAKRTVRRVTHETVPVPRITRDLKKELASSLRDDVRRLRKYLPADFDGWGIG